MQFHKETHTLTHTLKQSHTFCDNEIGRLRNDGVAKRSTAKTITTTEQQTKNKQVNHKNRINFPQTDKLNDEYRILIAP